ncbi:MAG: GNAT family N-acetyltransferase [Planctomycetota bacterium]|nr:GNAT family N-acetyltransferase [Planctomycetota bacterium]MDA1210921.1 GNAT family N-acetyltransferase [Planctomycetota bacterium]
MPVPPETARLSFREFVDDDFEAFHAICSDPLVMRFVREGVPWTSEQTQDCIDTARRLVRELGYCRWGVIHKDDERLIGFCGYVPTEGVPEIGWRLAKEYWGCGLATEAAKNVLSFGLTTLQMPRIIATVQKRNHASRRVTEKLGMTFESAFERLGNEVLLYSITPPVC